jgi:subtilase family serine protease
MRLKAIAAIAVLAAATMSTGGTPALASAPGYARLSCATTAPGRMGCLSEIRTGERPLAADGVPTGYGPADLRAAYKLPAGGGKGQTIAIVDAMDDPDAEADLATYRKTYGLPSCTTANGCFHKVDQAGGHDYPATDPGWAIEISLDLDMVSAACPNCGITLVEGTSPSTDDLGAAEDTAARLGAVATSNSYTTPEFDGMDQVAAHWDHPGTVTVVSSGDAGFTTAGFPAVLPNVIAVGGTTLTRAAGTRGFTEKAWSGSGSGCSAYIAKPAWQTDPHCHLRTMADLSADADPATGVAVYDTVPYEGRSGWWVVGGTSAASPFVAGVIGLAGNGRTLTPSYVYRNHGHLNDVIGGSNVSPNSPYGDCGGDYLCTAVKGYDAPTGWGTPNGTGAL